LCMTPDIHVVAFGQFLLSRTDASGILQGFASPSSIRMALESPSSLLFPMMNWILLLSLGLSFFLVGGADGFTVSSTPKKSMTTAASPKKMTATPRKREAASSLTTTSLATSIQPMELSAASKPVDQKPPAVSDFDLIPRDPATTTPQLLSALWEKIAQGSSMVRGEASAIIFPNMAEQFTPKYLNQLLSYFDTCKDVCDHFGSQTVLRPFFDPILKREKKEKRVIGFVVKSYRIPQKDLQGLGDEYQFDYDGFWDDEDEINFDGIDEELDGPLEKKNNLPEIVDKIPDSDEKIIEVSKRWVSKLMSDMGVCPFTSGPEMAGLPLGKVRYTVERSTSFEDVYARYWKEVVKVEQSDERELSTTLLICPDFCMENIEWFENFSTTLTKALTGLGVENLLQLVFFHPDWTFRDGGKNRQRGAEGEAANYARRSPWPMINLLRTTQVRSAQRGIPTGLVYQQNEKTLQKIGVEQLETMLRLRNWDAIADLKVNRRDMEALRVAQDFQQTGAISKQDTSFAYDSTPAANRVHPQQVNEGNLVKVISQALEKRLGKTSGDDKPTELTGPETCAVAMATDILLKELDLIAKSKPRQIEMDFQNESDGDPKLMASHKAMVSDVLYGGGGLLDNADSELATGFKFY